MARADRRHLHSEIWRESVAEEVGEELAFHIEARARELAAGGMTLERAREAARREMGDLSGVQAECEAIAGRRDRDMRRASFWSALGQDVRFGARQIRSAPWFSLLVIGTLAVGIGATTTIFSAVHAVVLRPPAFAEPDRVNYISETWQDANGDVAVGTFLDLQAQATFFDEIAAIDWGTYVLAGVDAAEQVLGAAVTPNYFRVFGAQPVLGRGFTPEDAQPGAARVVILSHAAFQERFGGSAAVLGTDLRLDGEPARVIGVLSPRFDPLLAGEAVWVPLSFTAEQAAARGEHWLDVVGRARAGVSSSSLEGQLEQIAADLRTRYPQDYEGRGLRAEPVSKMLVGDYDTRLFLLLGAVLVVLLIACANVANLLLARGAAREKEIAVRVALGAGRLRILRQLLTENLLIAGITVVVAIGIAALGARVIVAFAPADIPRIAETRVDPPVIAFAIVVGILSSLGFGLAPALRAARAELQGTLRSGGRDVRGSVRDSLRSALVVAEVALSVLLLTGAGLLIRTSLKVADVDPGFRTEGVVSARVSLPEQAYTDPVAIQVALQDMLSRIAANPAVTTAAVGSLPPLGPGGNEMFLNVEGRPHTNEEAVVARLRLISDAYLDALDISVLQGRGFDSRDARGGLKVAVISADLARKLWPGEDPIGKRFACCEGDAQNPSYKTVVGVAESVRSTGPSVDPYPEFYLPVTQAPDDSWSWIGRAVSLIATGNDTEALVAAIRSGVRGVDASIPVYDLSTMRDALRSVTAPARFNTLLLSLLGALGLVLAATGIYGVVSYFVNLRTKEIGVRMALGASTRSVLTLMTRQALLPVALGLVLGAAGALAATRLLRASLFDVTPADPLTFALVLSGLLGVALVAIVIPARRASRVEPTEALQS
jgi:predicted permease